MNQHGFTLVEVLVALSLFAVGMLGTGLLLTRNLHDAAQEHTHGLLNRAIHSENEILRRALDRSPQALQQELHRLQTGRPFPPWEATEQAGDIKLRLIEARDGNGAPLLQSPVEDWRPPYRLLIEATYHDPRIQRRQRQGLILTPVPTL